MGEWAYILLGVGAVLVSFLLLNNLINSPDFVKKNYRNAEITSLGGLVVLLAIIISQLVVSVFPFGQKIVGLDHGTFIIVLGFALIGLLDDLLGDKVKQGFKGHISELFKGRLTTGSLKLFGGPAIVLLALSPKIEQNGYLGVLIDVVCISLFANLFNLLDLSPGRTTKFALISLLPVFLFAEVRLFMFTIFAILAASLVLDIREKYMLGDTGSNVIGALVGVAFVHAFNLQHTLIITILVFALNILSEFVSFSKIIQRFLPLRLFEEVGQLKERKEWSKQRRNSSS